MLKDKLQVAQNKIIRFILNIDNRAHIGKKELSKAGFLDVENRVKQLKLGHAVKIRNKTSPYYLQTYFHRLSDIENRINTRARANDFYKPSVSTNTFIYSTISDYNDLPNSIKEIRNEKSFKTELRKYLESDPQRHN